MDNFSAPIPESFVFFRSMTVTTNALFFVRLLREPVQERMASSQAGHDGVCSCGAGFLIARAKRGRYALAGRSAERMPLYANCLSLLKRSEGQPGCSDYVRLVARLPPPCSVDCSGGMAGAATAVLVTELIKRILAVVSSQDIWGLIVVPLVGLAIAVLVLQGYGHGKALQTLAPEPARPRPRGRWSLNWKNPRDVIRADLTADVLATAGEEERFPLAPGAGARRRHRRHRRSGCADGDRVAGGAPRCCRRGLPCGSWSLVAPTRTGPPPWVVGPRAWPRWWGSRSSAQRSCSSSVGGATSPSAWSG